ncbi:CsbD family protein [Amycolatopsis pithecellobii]|uniref:CsbD family protein n=1 Tax=Amycolatopsis pithecellobii TaxID=664692 RepID=A0A6N7YZM6_9PSEU|nr:CsbD family protein [Amycolatopsis pithecellobii]MTD53899.1 CsbD family protein [Amycolatopsis pithecellobii]
MSDKFENKAEELKGRAKEGLGEATDNDEWKTEGRAEQGKSELKQAAEKVKDAAKDAFGKER